MKRGRGGVGQTGKESNGTQESWTRRDVHSPVCAKIEGATIEKGLWPNRDSETERS